MTKSTPQLPDLGALQTVLSGSEEMTLLIRAEGGVVVAAPGVVADALGTDVETILAAPGRFLRAGDLERATELITQVLSADGASESMTLWALSQDEDLVKCSLTATNSKASIGATVLRIRQLEAPQARDSLDSLAELDERPIVSFTAFTRLVQRVVDRRLERFWSLPIFARRLAADRGANFCVVAINLDRHGLLRTAMGATKASQVLYGMVGSIGKLLRGRDAIAYEGGSDVALLLDGVSDREHVTQVLDPYLKLIPRHFDTEGSRVPIETVVGIALSERRYETADAVIRDARAAATHVMRHRRRGRQVYSTQITREVGRRMSLAAALRDALVGGHLEPHYQPVLRLRDDEVVGFEALARWSSPKHGVVSPGEFIPLAEEIGMLPELGRLVLRKACEAGVAFTEARKDERGKPPLEVAVNVAAGDLLDPEFADFVESTLKSTGLPSRQLVLELTESTLIQDPPRAAEAMKSVQALGVRWALDDFGTGYASLTYLVDLPFDRLKIDRSLVPQRGSARVKVVHAMAQLAHALGLKVTMEGIETPEQRHLARHVGCDTAQGYLFDKALPFDDAVTRLVTKPWSTPPRRSPAVARVR